MIALASFVVSRLILATVAPAPSAPLSAPNTAQSTSPAAAAAPSPPPPPSRPPPPPAAEPPKPSETPALRTASNVVFAEVLGSGLLYSLNYERIFDSLHVGIRGGASYFSYPVSDYGKSGNLKLLTIPVVASYYLGMPKHKLQLGLGATFLYTGVSSDSTGTKFESDRSGAGIAVTAIIGYRYLPPAGGFTFGVAFTPLLRSGSFLPWGGAEAGYSF
jgi:hypothetical protein